MRQLIFHMVGARPQFLKLGPVYHAMAAKMPELRQIIVHSGQHTDPDMSDWFFRDLKLPNPSYVLKMPMTGAGESRIAGIQAEMIALMRKETPDLIVVYGDTLTTLASAQAAREAGIRLVHVEAGLRAFQSDIPEESIRRKVDFMSDFHLCPSALALLHLKNEGIYRSDDQSVVVGDVMLDVLAALRREESPREGAVITIHRNTSVDSDDIRRRIIEAIVDVSKKMGVCWPMHPRMRKMCNDGDWALIHSSTVVVVTPMSHGDLMAKIRKASLVITDSGGLQKESYTVRTPCIVARPSTEWVELLATGCVALVDPEKENFSERIALAIAELQYLPVDKEYIPLYGDGHSAKLAADFIHQWI